MTTDLNEISKKVTKVLLSCKHSGHIETASNYIDQVMTFIERHRLMTSRDAEIYHANLRGRLKMRVAEMFR